MGEKIVYGSLLVFLLLESIRDIKKKEISLILCLLGALLRVVLLIFYKDSDLGNVLIGSMVGFLFFAMSFLTGEKIGYGDGFIVLLTGFYLGFLGLITVLVYASFLLFFVSVFIYVFAKNKRDLRIPYVPFLFLGALGGIFL